jgi:hypothetical protein
MARPSPVDPHLSAADVSRVVLARGGAPRRGDVMRIARLVAFVLCAGTVAASSFLGCTGECQYYNDCPSGEVCNPQKMCVSNGLDGGGGITVGRPPRDGGTGGGTVVTTISTVFPIAWLSKDPRDPNRGMFPVYDPNGGNDDLRTFDLLSGAIRTPADIELLTLNVLDDGSPGAPCQADNLYAEPNIPSEHGKPETWLVCKKGVGLRIHYNNEFLQPAQPVEGASPDGYVVMPIVSTGVAFNDFPRRLAFERGGSSLHVYQLNANQDGLYITRLKDEVKVTFTEITQVWQLASVPTVGDVIVVFDRGTDGAAPRLVPLVRLFDTTAWEPALNFTGLETLPLPAKTHAVIRIANIDPRGLSPVDVPNVMTVEPETGYLRFFTLANVPNPVPPLELNVTLYEPTANFLDVAPASNERLLIEPAPGGEAATFYVHPRIGRIWRLPHTPNAEDIIYRYTLAGGALLPTGIIPTGALTTWVSVPSTLEMFKVTLDLDN